MESWLKSAQKFGERFKKMKEYIVVQYRHGKFDGVLSGMGKNKNTLDTTHSRSAAYFHKKELEKENWRKVSGLTYKVEPA